MTIFINHTFYVGCSLSSPYEIEVLQTPPLKLMTSSLGSRHAMFQYYMAQRYQLVMISFVIVCFKWYDIVCFGSSPHGFVLGFYLNRPKTIQRQHALYKHIIFPIPRRCGTPQSLHLGTQRPSWTCAPSPYLRLSSASNTICKDQGKRASYICVITPKDKSI